MKIILSSGMKKIGTFGSLLLLWKYRYRVLDGAINDIRQRFTGSGLGMLWVFIYPILQLSIFAALYTMIFKIRPSGLVQYEYVVLVFSGLVAIMAFGEVLSSATSSLSANKSLLLNTVFPAELIPLRVALASHITSLVGLIVTLLAGFIFGRANWQAILLVPLFWIFLLMFAMGIGWIFSLLSLVMKDVQHALGLILMLLFVLSPFAYTPEMVPDALKFIIYFNPLSYFVLTFQQLICYGAMPDPIIGGVAAFLGIGSFLIGFNFFKKAKSIFFDYA